jgi:hypothetical protein
MTGVRRTRLQDMVHDPRHSVLDRANAEWPAAIGIALSALGRADRHFRPHAFRQSGAWRALRARRLCRRHRIDACRQLLGGFRGGAGGRHPGGHRALSRPDPAYARGRTNESGSGDLRADFHFHRPVPDCLGQLRARPGAAGAIRGTDGAVRHRLSDLPAVHHRRRPVGDGGAWAGARPDADRRDDPGRRR